MNMFKFEIKRLLRSGLVWGFVSGAIMILFMALFPSMENSGLQEVFQAELEAFPEGLMEAFGIDLGIDFTNISEYLAYIIQYVAMAGCVYGIILGVNSLIKEETEGTIEFLYSQPIKRRTIVTNKIVSNVVIYGIYHFVLAAITVATCIAVKPEDVALSDMLGDIAMITLGMVFTGYIFMSIGFVLSAVLRSSRSAAPIGIALFFITFIFGIIGKLKESFGFFKHLSPFDYAPPSEMIKNGVELVNLSLGVIIILGGVAVTYYLYERKDMRI